MTITIDLPAHVEAALRAEAQVQGRAPAVLAAAAVAERYAPQTPHTVAEGSPEEDAAIEAALAAPFHRFDADSLQEKLLTKFGVNTRQSEAPEQP